MTDEVLYDKDVPLECKKQYRDEDWYNVCELVDYYNKIWLPKNNSKDVRADIKTVI